MTPEQIRERSQEKVNQVFSLMRTLKVDAVIKKQVTKDGFIEDAIYWMDNEQYPQPQDSEQAPKEVEEIKEEKDEKSTK